MQYFTHPFTFTECSLRARCWKANAQATRRQLRGRQAARPPCNSQRCSKYRITKNKTLEFPLYLTPKKLRLEGSGTNGNPYGWILKYKPTPLQAYNVPGSAPGALHMYLIIQFSITQKVGILIISFYKRGSWGTEMGRDHITGLLQGLGMTKTF